MLMKKFLLVLSLCLFLFSTQNFAQTRVKKVVFQGFWWDYWNSNFKNRWSDYLTELAPRLKAAGIDAIWIPPSSKSGSPSSVGYSPFDLYDLGDKYQKGGSDSLTVRTRMGSKDELLRMIAVMHANGIEVIQDIVLNHTNEAGTNNGTGGRDPQSPFSVANANGFKNFRYVSYATPLLDESQNDYFTRNGRWPKNYTNFYPNLFNNCTTGDICSPFFGPDISFEGNATGISSNIPTTGTATIGTIRRNYINPTQPANYMRDQARNWIMWLKKQTGVDGWRWDAVKHFPISVQEDLIYNTKYTLPAFAKGGENMLCIGEWIGSKNDLDNYVTAVRSGTEEHTGTFDFSLRGYGSNGGLYSMVLGMGNYNLQNLPGEQQSKRYFDYATQRVHRTLPFVNSHDTYRPYLATNGNYLKPLGDASGWNTGQELGGNGQHIDPREPRFFAAYATAFAMDGNPCVFFEDLFDVEKTGKRYSNLPTSISDLPIRPDIQNIIQAHQKLQFKEGDYAVPSALTGTQAPFYQKGSAGDHLVIERSGRAIIGVTDKFAAVSDNAQDEEVWITVTNPFWRNVDLYDYSGAHGLTPTRVYDDGRVLIKTAPVGHTIPGVMGHGYSIWAPAPEGFNFTSLEQMYAYLGSYNPSRNPQTTQEWEMADDLGDSHAKSLKQGGRLPANSTAQRTVGRIFAVSGKPITTLLYPEINGRSQRIVVYNVSGGIVSSITGTSSNTAPLTLNYTPTATGWYTIRINNTSSTVSAQKAWVNVSYTAPSSVDTRTSPAPTFRMNQQDPLTNETPVTTYSIYPNPTQGVLKFDIRNIQNDQVLDCILTDASGSTIAKLQNTLTGLEKTIGGILTNKSGGVYFIQLNLNQQLYNFRIIKY